jgi:peptide/nickel transport system substrate-binding protein
MSEVYWEMMTILNQEGGAVIPIFPNYVFATSSKIAHNEIEERWALDGYKAGLRWWFA